ncbi:MAG TPA: hypothetical protein VGN07_09295 [Steroidobacteraceae bacterium]
MKLDRISAVVQSRPVPPRADQSLPSPGELLLLTYADAEGADILATMGNGVALRLAGLSQWRRDLQPGDTLKVRVVSSDPILELEMEPPVRGVVAEEDPVEAGGPVVSRQAAMRVDQAALRQMAWQAPNAAALALSWRTQAQERWNGRMPVYEGVAEGSTATPATMLGPAPFREPPSALPPPNLERWLFPVYAWGGTQMMLGLLDADEERDSRRSARRKNPILRLELAPAALGRIVLQVQWIPGGIQMVVAVEHDESGHLVREAMPLVAAALSRAGLRLQRLRLQRIDALSSHGEGPDPLAQARFAAHASSLALFRVLAEAAVVLLQVLPGHMRINRASR